MHGCPRYRRCEGAQAPPTGLRQVQCGPGLLGTAICYARLCSLIEDIYRPPLFPPLAPPLLLRYHRCATLLPPTVAATIACRCSLRLLFAATIVSVAATIAATIVACSCYAASFRFRSVADFRCQFHVKSAHRGPTNRILRLVRRLRGVDRAGGERMKGLVVPDPDGVSNRPSGDAPGGALGAGFMARSHVHRPVAAMNLVETCVVQDTELQLSRRYEDTAQRQNDTPGAKPRTA